MCAILIHVGFPKAGSTFLQQWFISHPQIHATPGTVGGFASVTALSSFAAHVEQPIPRYFALSSESLVMPRRQSGQIPVNYAESDLEADDYVLIEMKRQRAADILHTLFPEAKILIVTRGFADILRSTYSQYVRAGGTMLFSERLPYYAPIAANLFDYDAVINLYRKLFGKNNLLIIPYELLCADTQQFLAVLQQWLGLDAHDFASQRVNPSLTAAEMYWYPRLSQRVYNLTKRLNTSRIYRRYVRALLFDDLAPWAARIARLPQRTVVMNDRIIAPWLSLFQGKALTLQDNLTYAPYLDDYLLNTQ